MIMWCGKFKGLPLHQVPASYLAYALEEWGGLRWDQEIELRAELVRRLNLWPPAPPRTPVHSGVSVQRVREVLDGVFRQAARRFHPDAGGNTQAMAAVNVLREMALAELDRLR